MFRAALLFLTCTTPFAALSQEAPWPPEVTAAVEEARSYCDDGEVSMTDDAVRNVDLNGDGTKDWIFDTGLVNCSTSASLYCGTLGCGVETLIDGNRASLTLFEWQVVERDGATVLHTVTSQGEADLVWNPTSGQWKARDQ